jgi:hypothetical protein
MTDLIFRTDGEEKFRIPYSPSHPYVGSKCPEMKLEVTKMDEIDPTLILKDKDCIYYRGVKYQRVEQPKPETLYDIIADWWDEIFINNNPSGQNIESLVDQIENWLPKEQSAAGSQNAYVECSVEGFNDCLTKIKGKLR